MASVGTWLKRVLGKREKAGAPGALDLPQARPQAAAEAPGVTAAAGEEELPAVVAEAPLTVPQDKLSLAVLVALLEGEASPSLYRHFVQLLTEKERVETLLGALNSRIGALATKVAEESLAFDELKYELLDDFELEADALPNLVEGMVSTWNLEEELPQAQEELVAAVAVLAQLEISRFELHTELKALLSRLARELAPVVPSASLASIEKLVAERVAEVESVVNTVTSDGEEHASEEEELSMEEWVASIEETAAQLDADYDSNR